jgi:SNF2 family DNA or RNA helicase
LIPTAAIKHYLNRPLDSHRWVKGLTARDLEEALAALSPKPTLNPRLRLHQRACFLLGVASPQFCYFLDMGTGKTVLSLELLKYWFQADKVKRAIIFVTSDKAFHTWEKQLKEFEIDLPLISLSGSSKEKWAQLEGFEEGLVLVAYPGAVAMVCDRPDKKGKLTLNKKLTKKLAHWADAIVMDESTRAGGHRSLTFKMIAQLQKAATIRYALAGRPFGRDPTMLWAQCFLVDGGKTLGETLGLFREAFFTEEPNPWDPKGYAKDYTFKQIMKPQLARLVRNCSITYSAHECIDMPKVVPILEAVRFPEETGGYYARALEELIEAKGNMREVKGVFLRMRQLTSGFVGLKNDETGERAEIEMMENPKLDRLFELIEELPEGHKAVVFHDYTYTGRKIVEGLKKLELKPIWLWSGTKNARAELERFDQDPECTVAVLNSKVGAMSLDGLQYVANYMFFAESPISPIDREQAEKRLARDGQKETVFIYDLVVKGSVDEKILQFHEEGRMMFEEIIRNPGVLKGL